MGGSDCCKHKCKCRDKHKKKCCKYLIIQGPTGPTGAAGIGGTGGT